MKVILRIFRVDLPDFVAVCRTRLGEVVVVDFSCCIFHLKNQGDFGHWRRLCAVILDGQDPVNGVFVASLCDLQKTADVVEWHLEAPGNFICRMVKMTVCERGVNIWAHIFPPLDGCHRICWVDGVVGNHIFHRVGLLVRLLTSENTRKQDRCEGKEKEVFHRCKNLIRENVTPIAPHKSRPTPSAFAREY